MRPEPARRPDSTPKTPSAIFMCSPRSPVGEPPILSGTCFWTRTGRPAGKRRCWSCPSMCGRSGRCSCTWAPISTTGRPRLSATAIKPIRSTEPKRLTTTMSWSRSLREWRRTGAHRLSARISPCSARRGRRPGPSWAKTGSGSSSKLSSSSGGWWPRCWSRAGRMTGIRAMRR